MSGIRYRGVRRDGTGVTGAADVPDGDTVAFVRDRYDAGWRSLVVTDVGTGDEVGWIRVLDGHRTWAGSGPDEGLPPDAARRVRERGAALARSRAVAATAARTYPVGGAR